MSTTLITLVAAVPARAPSIVRSRAAARRAKNSARLPGLGGGQRPPASSSVLSPLFRLSLAPQGAASPRLDPCRCRHLSHRGPKPTAPHTLLSSSLPLFSGALLFSTAAAAAASSQHSWEDRPGAQRRRRRRRSFALKVVPFTALFTTVCMV